MSERQKSNGLASAGAWREAARADRQARACRLELPSGAVILAAKPEPMEWILCGRIPQQLLGAALEPGPDAGRTMTREEIIELAAFAQELVKASVVEPRIGDGTDEIALEEIPIEDRAFIFEWACRALGDESAPRRGGSGNVAPAKAEAHNVDSRLRGNDTEKERQEGSIPKDGIERFRAE